MFILGVSAFYHDSAACIIKNGEIIAAVQEERFTRKKHDPSFPINAINYCLNEAEIAPDLVEKIVFYEKPFTKFERLLETYLAYAPFGIFSFAKSMPLWIKDKLFQKSNIIKLLNENITSKVNWSQRLLFSEHHLSHAASAFFPSPFEKAAVLTLDGVGEWTTASVAVGSKNNLKIIKEIRFPHSLGLLYSAFTYYTGFKVNSGEYKVMGLAPYGKPKYVQLIKERLINIAEDGSFQLNMKYFSYPSGLKMTNKKFNDLFGGPPRKPESELTQKEMDLAASIQQVIEEVVVKIAKSIQSETSIDYLCLAGGVALNCVANGFLVKEKIFKDVWIQPAAGDAGGAIGAALSAWHIYLNKPRKNNFPDSMKGSYLGPSYNDKEIEDALDQLGANYSRLDDNMLYSTIAKELASEKAIGWMQGRMEFGPRALGGRSIIADPRSPRMQKQLNLKVKYRESFRPFAPSILYEEVGKWFNLKNSSPYMLLVSTILDDKKIPMSKDQEKLFGIKKLNIPRSQVPAITHVDYSARIQTVHKETNEKYHKLISTFFNITGCPILVNTSFNIRGEPIVCTPSDAFKCFMGTEMDVLVIGNYVMFKGDQKQGLNTSYKEKYELD